VEIQQFFLDPQGPGEVWIHFYDEPRTWLWDGERPPVSEHRLELTFELTEDGKDVRRDPVAVVLRQPAGLSPRLLNRFAWAYWIRLGWSRARVSWSHSVDWMRESQQLEARARRKVQHRPPKHPGRRGHTDAHYARVAEEYRRLTAEGARNPGMQIARQFTVSRDTVSGWINECRARGLLGPGQKGRAG
jgi:hypothetical protein